MAEPSHPFPKTNRDQAWSAMRERGLSDRAIERLFNTCRRDIGMSDKQTARLVGLLDDLCLECWESTATEREGAMCQCAWRLREVAYSIEGPAEYAGIRHESDDGE